MTIQAQSVSHVKSHFAQVIEGVQSGEGPIIVTQNGMTAAVIEDPVVYQRNQEALAMLKLIAMGEMDIAKGRTLSHEDVFSSARRRLKRLHKE